MGSQASGTPPCRILQWKSGVRRCHSGRGYRGPGLAHVIRMCQILGMAKMIQVRDVPDRLHRELVRRARLRQEPLTRYIQSVLEREVSRPPAEEVFARIHSRRRVLLNERVATAIRAERSKRHLP
jgi:hypothetical protein